MRWISRFLILISLLTSTATNAEGILVASWNMRWLTTTETENNRRNAQDFDRLKRIARSIDADIIALQEVENAETAFKVFGDEYEYYFSNRRNTLMRVGFAVRKDVVVIGSFVYEPLALDGMRYGVDITVSTKENKKLRFLNVHLKSGCFIEELPSSKRACEIIERQAKVLREWTARRAEEGSTFMILGDFNRRLGVEESNNIVGVMSEINSAFQNQDNTLRTVAGTKKSKCWGGEYPEFIDHFVVGPKMDSYIDSNAFRELAYRKDLNRKFKKKISDHCPIQLRLEV
jgi:endonuclease/exonuclease/phosphatase family metal-dependent hydrolase